MFGGSLDTCMAMVTEHLSFSKYYSIPSSIHSDSAISTGRPGSLLRLPGKTEHPEGPDTRPLLLDLIGFNSTIHSQKVTGRWSSWSCGSGWQSHRSQYVWTLSQGSSSSIDLGLLSPSTSQLPALPFHRPHFTRRHETYQLHHAKTRPIQLVLPYRRRALVVLRMPLKYMIGKYR